MISMRSGISKAIRIEIFMFSRWSLHLHRSATRVDVLGALRLQLETDLLPFPVRFPEVWPVVPRAQLAETVKLIRQLKNPLLIHADGGIGKTVFLQSLANSLSAENKCV